MKTLSSFIKHVLFTGYLSSNNVSKYKLDFSNLNTKDFVKAARSLNANCDYNIYLYSDFSV